MGRVYVSKDVLIGKIDALGNEPHYQHDGEDYYVGVSTVSQMLSKISDVVKIVRCKNCVSYDRGMCWEHSEDRPNGHAVLVNDDDFCSRGIKK